jgi:hypothetical protein
VRHKPSPELAERRVRSNIETFCTSLRESQFTSIDRFLEKRQEFADIGKKCVALNILEREREYQIGSAPDDWIKFMIGDVIMRDVDKSRENVRIVTFNYDRLVEFSLARSVRAIDRRCSEDQAMDFAASFDILHVYGEIETDKVSELRSSPSMLDADTLAYDAISAANGIPLMGERATQDIADSARKWIFNWAERVVFLGFGYDTENLTQIGFKPNFDHKWSHGIGGTAIGLKRQELERAHRWTDYNAAFNTNLSCLDYLRENIAFWT